MDDRRDPLTTATQQGAQGVKGTMIQFLVNSNYNNYVPSSRGRPKSDLIWLYVHVGESRHGNLGTYSRDGEGDNPLLSVLYKTNTKLEKYSSIYGERYCTACTAVIINYAYRPQSYPESNTVHAQT